MTVTPSRTGRLVLAAAALALVTACGSTVQVQGQVAATNDVAGGLAAPGSAAAAGAPLGSTANGGTAAASGSTTSPLPGATTNQPANGAPVGAVTSVGARPGSGPIDIGFLATTCPNCSLLKTDAAPETYSDQQVVQAVVNGLNKRGGIGGRKIRPHFAPIDTAQAYSTQYQAACSTFVDDHHVAAVLGYGPIYSDILGGCLDKAGIPWINSAGDVGDNWIFRQRKHYVTNVSVSLNAMYLSGLESAMADGWITRASRLGIIRGGCGYELRTHTQTVLPFLKQQGLTLASDQLWSECYDGGPDLSSYASFIQSATLKMRSSGVDVVVAPPLQTLLAAQNAQAQNWHPKFVTFGAGFAVAEGILPEEQLKRVHTAGWYPTIDLNVSRRPPLRAVQKDCLRLAHDGGADLDPTQYWIAFDTCDAVLLYAGAVTRAKGQLGASALMAALETFGTSFESVTSLKGATSLGPGRHHAPLVYRSNLYQDSCSCFLYVGPERRLHDT